MSLGVEGREQGILLGVCTNGTLIDPRWPELRARKSSPRLSVRSNDRWVKSQFTVWQGCCPNVGTLFLDSYHTETSANPPGWSVAFTSSGFVYGPSTLTTCVVPSFGIRAWA